MRGRGSVYSGLPVGISVMPFSEISRMMSSQTHGKVICTFTIPIPLVLIFRIGRTPCSCIITANRMFDFDNLRA